MNWITITESNVATYQAGGFVDAYKTAALNDESILPLDSAITAVVLKVRGYIKTGGYSVDKDTSKVPAEIESDVLAMIIAIAKPRIYQELTSIENTNLQNANTLMRDIAKGDFAVSTPDDPESASATTQSSGGATLVRPARGIPSRRDFNGL